MNVYASDTVFTEVDCLRRQYSNDAPEELLVLHALQRIHPVLVKMAAYYSKVRGASLQSLIEERLKANDFQGFSQLTRSQLIDLAEREEKAAGREYLSTNGLVFALTSHLVIGIRELLSEAGVDPDDLRDWVLRIYLYQPYRPRA
jgi:hypothetical protein